MCVMIKEFYLKKEKNIYTKMALFTYNGVDDPIIHLDNAIEQYTIGCNKSEYNEFIDMNMDPYSRIILKDINIEEMRESKLKAIFL